MTTTLISRYFLYTPIKSFFLYLKEEPIICDYTLVRTSEMRLNEKSST